MTVGRVPRRHVSERQRDDLGPVQGDDPVHGTCEADIEVGPPHRFLEGDRRDPVHDELGKDLLDGPGRFLFHISQILAPIRLEKLQIGDGHPLTPGEPLRRLGRLPRRVEGDALRGSENGLLRRLLPILKPPDDVGQPAGSPQDVDPVEREPPLSQNLGELLAPVPERGPHKPRGELFAADLQQVVVCHLSLPVR